MKNIDKYRGCLIGGAAGDALGYAVEFLSEGMIFSRYGESGITVKPNNADELADAINKLAENPELRERFGKEGYNRVCRYFSNSDILGRIYNVLSEERSII